MLTIEKVLGFLLRNPGESFNYDFPVYEKVIVGGEKPPTMDRRETKSSWLAHEAGLDFWVGYIMGYPACLPYREQDVLWMLYKKYIDPYVIPWGQEEKQIRVVKVTLEELPIKEGVEFSTLSNDDILDAAERMGLEELPLEALLAMAAKRRSLQLFEFRDHGAHRRVSAPHREKFLLPDEKIYEIYFNTDNGVLTANHCRTEEVKEFLFKRKESI